MFKLQTVSPELVKEANIVGFFEQSRSDSRVDGHGRLNHAMSNVVDRQRYVVLGVLSVLGGDDLVQQTVSRR